MLEKITLRFPDDEVRDYTLIAEGEEFWIVSSLGETLKVYKDEAERIDK